MNEDTENELFHEEMNPRPENEKYCPDCGCKLDFADGRCFCPDCGWEE